MKATDLFIGKGISSGTALHRITSAASTNITLVKNSASKLVGGFVKNRVATERFLKIYDKASAPVLASDVPVFIIALTQNQQVSFEDILGSRGHTFVNGIAYSITGAIANNDTTAVAANDVVGLLVFSA